MPMSALVFTAALAFAQPAPAPAPPAPAPLELEVSPIVDLHFWVRKMAEQKGELPAVAGLPEAVAAAKAFQTELGPGALWGIFEGNFVGLESAADLLATAEKLPEAAQMFSGRTIKLREAAVRLARSYVTLEKPFLERVWPRHREAIEGMAAQVRRDLLPKAPQVYEDLARHLDVPVPSRPIPVYLTAEGPWPGAVTARTAGNTGVCFVAAEVAQGSQRVETVVHETIHALDVMAGEGSVLGALRKRIAREDLRDFPHTVMFVQAAGTVRKVLFPEHKDYGDVEGYYAKVPRASAVVVPAWRAYLAGEISRDEALNRIAALSNEKGGPKAAPEKPPKGVGF
ncbi:MAG TPA: hypothetical protein VJ725_23865 [Thermoanaerobaculia bacterium]|nr:hypothetical protein [Thermoanaerobaculia bacterium]